MIDPGTNSQAAVLIINGGQLLAIVGLATAWLKSRKSNGNGHDPLLRKSVEEMKTMLGQMNTAIATVSTKVDGQDRTCKDFRSAQCGVNEAVFKRVERVEDRVNYHLDVGGK